MPTLGKYRRPSKEIQGHTRTKWRSFINFF